jgi:hypothetical protein
MWIIYGLRIIGSSEFFYVGKTHSLDNRLSAHKRKALANDHRYPQINSIFQNHEVEIVKLDESDDPGAESKWYDLISQTHKLINRHPTLAWKNYSTMKGKKLSSEHKAAISKAHLGKTLSEETRRKISAVQIGKKRAPFSQSHLEKMSIARRGKKKRPLTDEEKMVLSQKLKGKKKKPLTVEQKEKLRLANIGKKHSPETKEEMSRSHRGKKHKQPMSEEHKKKLSQSRKGKPWSKARREAQRRQKNNAGN